MLWYSVSAVVCVAGAGFFVGLQIALFSIDRLFLRVLSTTGTPKERQQAKSLLAVLKLQHWTLVALVLMNAVFVMTLPILLETMFDEITALIVSITAVLFAGEVLPLAVFVRWAIPVCSYFIHAIWFAIIVTAPVSYPMGKVLDRVLGHSEEPLDREDLAALIVGPRLGENDEESTMMEVTSVRVGGGDGDDGGESAQTAREKSSLGQLRESEVKMLQAAMLLSTDTVQQHLRTKAEDAFMLSSHDSLDREMILCILTTGYSRVPVYFGEDRRHIIGVLIVNSLVSLCFSQPDPPPRVSDYSLREVLRLSREASLYDAYLAFRNGPSNMAIIYDHSGAMAGLLTLNDVLATLYNADPVTPATLSEQYLRRQRKMVELVEGMKALQVTKRVVPVSLGTSRLGEPVPQNVRKDDAQNQAATIGTLFPTARHTSSLAKPTPPPRSFVPLAGGQFFASTSSLSTSSSTGLAESKTGHEGAAFGGATSP